MRTKGKTVRKRFKEAGSYDLQAALATCSNIDSSAACWLDLRCGTSNGNRNDNTGAVTILVSPTSAFVASGGPQQFKATVDNASNPAVTWQVNGVESGNATTGTITSSGLYTAPGAAGRVTVWKSKKSKMSNRLTFEFAVKVRKSTTRELQASRQSSWLLSLQLQHESSSILLAGMENGCG